MGRIVGLFACALLLGGCSSFPGSSSFSNLSMPGFDSASSGGAATVRVESDPPGAEAKTTTGVACRTPCALAVPAGNSTVTFSSTGYEPQASPLRVSAVRADWESETGAPSGMSIDPNPVYAVLTPAPPPAPPPKKKTPPRRAPVAAAPPPAQQPASAAAPMTFPPAAPPVFR
jgi:hypothetical protein